MNTLYLGLVVAYIAVTGHAQMTSGGNCILEASELGPDWYKVPQPVPMGLEDDPTYQRSYTHMPCAPTTVFELSVCGCTNLLSFIFSSLGGDKKKRTGDTKHKVNPGDLVKTIDPKESSMEAAGSLLINTRTGEVRKCPFRASSRGPQWYLVREPGDIWRPMECATGTLFDKLKCTCIHQAIAARDPTAPEDKDIVILEEAFNTFGSGTDNTISQSLGIKVADVDFGLDKDIPFWRRNPHQNHIIDSPPVQHQVKPDVAVTLDHLATVSMDTNFYGVDIGSDRISEAHRALLLKLKKGPTPFKTFKKKAAPLLLDRLMTDRLGSAKKVSLNVKWESDKASKERTINKYHSFKDKFKETLRNGIVETKNKGETGDASKRVNSTIKSKSAIGGKTAALGTVFGQNVDVNTLANVLSDISDQIVSKQDVNGRTDRKVDNSVTPTNVDNTIFQTECVKKPMPGNDPHYFLQPVPGVGYVPYTCHGNHVYDHTICACRRASGETSYNEAAFPIQECTKKPIPEFGQRFFSTHIHGLGYIPIGCHGNTVFDEKACTCI